MATARLIVRREHAFTAILNRFSVFVNGAEVGSISSDEVRTFDVPVGSLVIGLDWTMQIVRAGLRAITFDNVREGDNIHLECIAKPGLFRHHIVILQSRHEASTFSYQSKSKTDVNNENPQREQTYAEIFEIESMADASISKIKERYKKLARQYHPDRYEDLAPEFRKAAMERMKQINEAYSYFKQKLAF